METAGPRVGSPHRMDARSKLAEFYSKQSRRRKSDDIEKRKQLQDYVAWVNTYLKRRPGVKLICDLRSFSDGVTLVQLAEIVAKDSIAGIIAVPSSVADRTANIEKTCDFLKEKGVTLPPDIVKDISDSSLKATMKVVLAIADHFLPTSVKRGHTLPQQNRTMQSPSHIHHHQNGQSTPPQGDHIYTRTLPVGKSPPYFRDDYRESSLQRSLTPERPESPIYSTPIDAIEGEVAESARRPSIGRSGRRRENGGLSESKHVLILEELAQSQTEVMDVKNQMLQLFALLQRNPNCSPATVTTPELPRSESHHSDSETSDGLTTNIAGAGQDNGRMASRSIDQLREQLEQCQVEGEEEDTGQLKKELEKSREQLKKLKSEFLRKDYKHDTEMVDMKNVLSDKEILILSLRQELSQHREGISKEMEQLSQQLEHSRTIQSSFLAQLREKDAELAILRDQVQRGSHDHNQMTNGTSEKHKKTLPEEMDIVRTCLGALRTSLSPQDPQQQTIDQLEQAMASLADQRLMSSPTNTTSPTPSKRHNSRSGRHKAVHGQDDSGDNKYSRKKYGAGNGEVSPGMASYPSPISPDEVTKVTYYLDKDDTPYRTSIPKRCFEVTLKDFRIAICKSSSHKFFFKSLDPDIGAVKEEVSDSTAIIPNYEGKIVGWVSERTK